MSARISRYSVQACCEVRALCLGFHPRLGAESPLQVLQGAPGVVDTIARFLLEPPLPVVDTFCQELTGAGVLVAAPYRTAVGRHHARFVCRCNAASAGMKSIHEGLRKWTVRCEGDSFAIGIIADDSWHDFVAETVSWDWPFVSGNFGQGFALIKRKGEFFLSSRMRSSALSAKCNALILEADKLNVVLDIERALLFFEADDVEIPNSMYKLTNEESAYRFIASIPDPTSSVTFV